jgi:hypothetical protein
MFSVLVNFTKRVLVVSNLGSHHLFDNIAMADAGADLTIKRTPISPLPVGRWGYACR